MLSSNTFFPIIHIYVDQTACEEVSCLHGLRRARFATTERLGLLSALLDTNIAMLETNIMAKRHGAIQPCYTKIY